MRTVAAEPSTVGMEGELAALRADGLGSAEFERGLRAFAAGERAGTVG